MDSERFQRGVGLLRQFRDVPRIIPFLGISFPSGSSEDVAIITDFAEGGNFAQALKAEELCGQQKSSILIDVLLGLQALHSAGAIHRDVKPSNILLNAAKDHAYLCDFGASRFDEPGVTQATIFTQAYVAEEAVTGKAVLASDIFSFGVVLREAVAPNTMKDGDPPWVVVRDRMFDVGAVGNPAVASLILDCVRRDPAARPPVAVVLDRLRAIGPSLLEKSLDENRKIRFREGDDPTVCSFTAKTSDTVGQALEEAGLEGRLFFDGDPVPLRLRVAKLDLNTIYVLR